MDDEEVFVAILRMRDALFTLNLVMGDSPWAALQRLHDGRLFIDGYGRTRGLTVFDRKWRP